MSFELTFSPSEGRCLVATSTVDSHVTSFWPDPTGNWLVDTTAAYGGHGDGYSAQATLCTSSTTSMLTLTATSWVSTPNGHEPREGRERFEGTLSR